MEKFITGIQQVGIGVTDAVAAKYLYRDLFGMNVLLFDDTAFANLMTRYTGNEIHKRKAILSMNLAGGGGLEIWQFLSRTGEAAASEPCYGDLGIFATKIKTADIEKAHASTSNHHGTVVSGILQSSDNRRHFWVEDPYGNIFDIVESDCWFNPADTACGGVCGAVIGVTDIERSVGFYKDFLGIDEVVYDTIGSAEDAPPGTNDATSFRRVLLKKNLENKGAFSQLLGEIEIELVENRNKSASRIFENRFWGDCGFIHLCFDVLSMDGLKELGKRKGFQFTVDSAGSFEMGEAAGRFCYVEDPDGTLIELVETHKIPVMKKLGLYLNLKKRKSQSPLPKWMVKMLGFNRIK